MRKTLIVLFAAALITAGCRQRQRSPSGARAGKSGPIVWGVSARAPSIVYPYSVIAGGVESAADVAQAVARDPEVARHYSDIKVSTLEAVHLKSDTSAYVSFRKDGRIYWTREKVRLVKGERVLSDGPNCVRGRCGNRISWQPRVPVLPKEIKEPGSAQLITPEVRGQSIDELPAQPVLSGFLPNSAYPESLANLIRATALPPIGGVAAGGPAAAGGGAGAGAAGGGGSVTGGPGPSFLGVLPAIPVATLPGATVPPATTIPAISALPVALVPGILTPVPQIPSANAPTATVPARPAITSNPVPGYPPVAPPTTPPEVVPPQVVPPTNPSAPGTPAVPPSGPQTPPGLPGQPTPFDVTPDPPRNTDTNPVPEPATMFLMGLGLIVLSLRLRKPG